MVTDDDGPNKKKRQIGGAQALQQQEDILFQILTRLRAKSLVRFKLACKSWMALISDPFFISSHSERLKKNKMMRSESSEILTMTVLKDSVVLMDENGRHESCFPLFWMIDDNLRFFPKPTIVHCEGLFLIGYTAKRLMVCNPATREVVALPPTAYTPDVKNSGVGIGFDRSTNKYKVIRIFERSREKFYEHGFEVITLGAAGNSWRQIKAYPHYHELCMFLTMVTVQGAVYRIIFERRNKNCGSHSAILRFDLSNEEFTVIDPPCRFDLSNEEFTVIDPPCRKKILRLTELQGHLCCYGFYTSSSYWDPIIWVWLLINDNPVGWTLRYTLYHIDANSFMPIAIDQEGCLLFKYLLHMHRYDPQTNQFYMMSDHAYARENIWCHTASYVETMMPISSDR